MILRYDRHFDNVPQYSCSTAICLAARFGRCRGHDATVPQAAQPSFQAESRNPSSTDGDEPMLLPIREPTR